MLWRSYLLRWLNCSQKVTVLSRRLMGSPLMTSIANGGVWETVAWQKLRVRADSSGTMKNTVEEIYIYKILAGLFFQIWGSKNKIYFIHWTKSYNNTKWIKGFWHELSTFYVNHVWLQERQMYVKLKLSFIARI